MNQNKANKITIIKKYISYLEDVLKRDDEIELMVAASPCDYQLQLMARIEEDRRNGITS